MVFDDGHSYCFKENLWFGGTGEFYLPEVFTYEYLPWRGVSRETMRFYDVKTKINYEGLPVALGFPYFGGAYKIRSLGQKDFHTQGDITDAGLFGYERFESGGSKTVTITEGELDALSLHQVLRRPVVSVQSASSAVRDVRRCYEWLAGFDRIYLCFDSDSPGRDGVERVAKLLPRSKVYDVRLTRHKDANAYVQVGDVDDLLNAWNNAKPYVPDTVSSSLTEFTEELRKPVKVGIPYPWKSLTEMTYGMRTGETVLLAAQEKVGKTELMHFIEHQLLKETDDAIAAIFLEEQKQRHLQALVGIELGRPVHLPDSGVGADEMVLCAEKLLQKDDRLFLYKHFGGDTSDRLLDTIRYLVCACGVRWVIFDHLSMAVQQGGAESERAAIDRLSSELEQLVKELNFGLIIVSHVNDYGQIRGSRWPGKVFDMRINATRDKLHSDPIERNTIYLTISDSRYPGKTGPVCKLIWDVNTYSYREEPWDGTTSAANDNVSFDGLDLGRAA